MTKHVYTFSSDFKTLYESNELKKLINALNQIDVVLNSELFNEENYDWSS